jgi:hypothetical protein
MYGNERRGERERKKIAQEWEKVLLFFGTLSCGKSSLHSKQPSIRCNYVKIKKKVLQMR